MAMQSSRIILSQTQIDAINWKNFARPETGLCDLAEQELIVSISELRELFQLDNLGQELRYTKDGVQHSDGFYNALKRKINDSLPGKTNSFSASMTSPQRAVAIQNGLIRAYPTMAGSYRENEIGELDRFAVSVLKLGEPVLIYCTDTSGLWCFVRAAQIYGWVFRDLLAMEPDERRWEQYCTSREYAVVTDSRKKLDYTDYNGRHRVQTLFMGTRLPLYDAAQKAILIGLPVKDKRGNLAIQQVLTARDGSLIPGNMPMSAQNIISQAKKMLGEPYGWGGTGFHRDCTSLVTDVYAVFGLVLPRNSRDQMKMHGIEPCPQEEAQKRVFLSKLPPGSLLYAPGHAMLYLGVDAGQMQMLHSVYAISLPAKDRLISHKIRRVVQGDLLQYRVSGETYFDAMEAVWVPDHQKHFLSRGWFV